MATAKKTDAKKQSAKSCGASTAKISKITAPIAAPTPATLNRFFAIAREFTKSFNAQSHPSLRGKDNGKTIGNYVESAFKDFLVERGIVQRAEIGNAAKGIDLPTLRTDIKVTSIRQPQSSSPYRDHRQKIEGLGYNLALFVYEKIDTADDCNLLIRAARFIPQKHTADYASTVRIQEIVKDGGTAQDIFGYLKDRNLPIDDETLVRYSEELLAKPPATGYLTISNALQWRLQYNRVISRVLEEVTNLDPPGAKPPSEEELQKNLATPDEDYEESFEEQS